ncbi:hypothetical protein RJ498_003777 [Pluralibacter gergoviae]
MVSSVDIQNFIDGPSYKKALDMLAKEYSIFINKDEMAPILLSYDANKINLSGALLSDLEFILCNRLELFLKYLDVKLKIILSESDQQEGNDDEDVLIKRLLPYKNFLIIHLIEYYLIENNIDGLDDYLKKIRIPNSKKYSMQIQKIYKSL